MSLRVAIVAEDPLAKSGIAQLVAECESLELCDEAEAQVLIFEGAASSLEPGAIPIVAVSDRDGLRELLGAGARAVLGRDLTAPELEAAVIAAARGLVALSPAALDELLSAQRREVDDFGAEPLTPRELEVLTLMAEGLSNRLIGVRLGISENTVKFHVNALLAKLDAETRTEAVVRGARLGLILL